MNGFRNYIGCTRDAVMYCRTSCAYNNAGVIIGTCHTGLVNLASKDKSAMLPLSSFKDINLVKPSGYYMYHEF